MVLAAEEVFVGESGTSTTKQLPTDGLLRTLTVPPWAWQMDFTMARPRPAPSAPRSGETR
jgi:hypothetical protein